MYNKNRKNGSNARRRLWIEKVKPRLEEIENLRANGATGHQIAEHIGVHYRTLLVLKDSEPELAEAFARAHNRSKEILENGLWKLARGEVVSIEETEIRGKDGELKRTQKKILHLAPSLAASLAVLRQHHGWVPNPKIDNVLVNTLSAEEWNAKSAEIFSALGDPSIKSSAADNFRAPEAPEVSPLSHEVGPFPRKSQSDLQGTDPKSEILGPDASDGVAGVERAEGEVTE